MRLAALAVGLTVVGGGCQVSDASGEGTRPTPAQTAPAPAARPGAGRVEPPRESGVGGRVYVVERSSNQLAVYDFVRKELLPGRVTGLGDMHHATMTFSPDLRHGFVATRDGVLSRIDLQKLLVTGTIKTSKNSIDLAISQDGRHLAVAEYIPGGVSIIDLKSFKVAKQISSAEGDLPGTGNARMTGMVDAPGNLFLATSIEGYEVWVIDAGRDEFPIRHKVALGDELGLPYDAMITPDGRHYLVGHLGRADVSVVDITMSTPTARVVSLVDPNRTYDASPPAKLPHMASWAVAGNRVFVPLVGEDRLAVLDRETFEFKTSVPLRGHPVYAVRSPSEREIWVSFSGEEDDAYVQIVDTRTLAIVDTIEVGGRIYHMDFTPRGSHALISANRANALFLVNATTHAIEDRQALESPSGIFGVWRAYRIGL